MANLATTLKYTATALIAAAIGYSAASASATQATTAAPAQGGAVSATTGQKISVIDSQTIFEKSSAVQKIREH